MPLMVVSGEAVIAEAASGESFRLALILFHKKTIIEKYLKTLVLFSPVLIFVPYILSRLFLLGHITVSVGPLLQAVGICSLILHSLTNTKLVI